MQAACHGTLKRRLGNAQLEQVARIIADLAGATGIGTRHLTEAINYRHLDRGR